ncbi:MAG: hypothetical protein HRT37_15015 [Alteromonadaceae bacterium]|nr:hypothetical protein [Alteromonadaceae bacterium]
MGIVFHQADQIDIKPSTRVKVDQPVSLCFMKLKIILRSLFPVLKPKFIPLNSNSAQQEIIVAVIYLIFPAVKPR